MEPRRLAEHLQQAALSAGPAKEVRIFGLEEELRRRYEAAAGAAGAALDRAHLRAARLRWAADALPRLTLAASAAWVAWLGYQGAATPGDVLLVLQVAEHFLWLERHVRTSLVPIPDPVPPPARLERGIRLERVSFRYPGTERWVLQEVDLELPAGAVVALVGENGAGKTTLVKLLLRLYEPTAGRVLVDGVDLSRIPVEAWRRRCTAAFQDFARLEVVARESVGVGDLPRAGENAAVMAALVRAGAEDIPDQLPQGLDTPLGRTWGGVDLSGGQWQKLAVARAMMREEPLPVVLDEPAAALDAETDYALFQRYAEAARASRGRGAVTLLVSHRFTTVRMADLIVVLKDGRVVEVGDHETLMAAGGLYAQLYPLQARAYRDR